MCASKLAPAMPRGIGSSGIGACIIASHLRHEQAGRIWRTTSKRPGMYSNTSVTLSPTWRSSVPPQVLHVCRRVNDLTARQLGRQPAALLFIGRRRAGWCRRSVRRLGLDRRRGWCSSLRRCRLDLLQCQLKLLDGTLGVLRACAELLATQLGKLCLQLLGLQRLLDQAVFGGGQFGSACREHLVALGYQRILGDQLPSELRDLRMMVAAIAHGRSIYTASRSSRHGRLPCALWRAPVDAFEQHRDLRGRQRDGTFLRDRPHKTTLLKPLGKQAKT